MFFNSLPRRAGGLGCRPDNDRQGCLPRSFAPRLRPARSVREVAFGERARQGGDFFLSEDAAEHGVERVGVVVESAM